MRTQVHDGLTLAVLEAQHPNGVVEYTRMFTQRVAHARCASYLKLFGWAPASEVWFHQRPVEYNSNCSWCGYSCNLKPF